MTFTMPSAEVAAGCRGCGSDTLAPLVDLGPHPDPDALLDSLTCPDAPVAPVRASICATCGLVQLVGARPPGPPLPHGHDIAARPDDPWVRRLVTTAARDRAVVVDIDTTPHGVASIFAEAGLPVIGFGPPAPRDPHSSWLRPRPFDQTAALELAAECARPRLVIASHALAHVEDLQWLIGAIDAIVASDGYLAIELHHVLGLADGQFDVLNHAHRSYVSLHALERLLAPHDLRVVNVLRTAEYGGTLRVIARRSRVAPSRAAASLRQLEEDRRLARPEGYGHLADLVAERADELITFLDRARRNGRKVAGYGAASRGTTLLNVAGVRERDLMFVADRSASKQGRFLPGCRVPIVAPDEIDRSRPDDVLILPWPMATKVVQQLSGARARGTRFVVAMPRLRTVS
jgi:hypothetical protein